MTPGRGTVQNKDDLLGALGLHESELQGRPIRVFKASNYQNQEEATVLIIVWRRVPRFTHSLATLRKAGERHIRVRKQLLAHPSV